MEFVLKLLDKILSFSTLCAKDVAVYLWKINPKFAASFVSLVFIMAYLTGSQFFIYKTLYRQELIISGMQMQSYIDWSTKIKEDSRKIQDSPKSLYIESVKINIIRCGILELTNQPLYFSIADQCDWLKYYERNYYKMGASDVY